MPFKIFTRLSAFAIAVLMLTLCSCTLLTPETSDKTPKWPSSVVPNNSDISNSPADISPSVETDENITLPQTDTQPPLVQTPIEESGNISESSTPAVFSGLTEISGKYYLTITGGSSNEASPKTMQADSFSLFMDKMTALDFSQDDLISFITFGTLTDNGYLVCNNKSFYKPSYIPDGYVCDIESPEGFEYSYKNTYDFIMTTADGGASIVQTYIGDGNEVEALAAACDSEKSFDSISLNSLYTDITEKVGAKESADTCTVSYTNIRTNISYDVMMWGFTSKKITYTVCELYKYSDGITDDAGNLLDTSKPISVTVYAENGTKSFILQIDNANIAITKKFLVKFGVSLCK